MGDPDLVMFLYRGIYIALVLHKTLALYNLLVGRPVVLNRHSMHGTGIVQA